MRGITQYSNSIIEALLSRLPGWLQEDMARLGGDAFAAAFIEALQRRCRGLCEVAPSVPGEPPAQALPPAAEMRLLDEDVAGEDAMLEAIARRFAGSASLPLLLLGQRFGVLLDRPPLPATDLPLGPRAFCDAMADAAARMELDADARIELYRRVDVEGMSLYADFADAQDLALDQAGVLEGMSFVPLRRRTPTAQPAAQAAERDALQAVRSAAEALLPASQLPPAARQARRDGMAALARHLMQHGRSSSQWSDCIAVAETLQDAARGQGPAPLEAQAWLRKAFRQLGYGDGEAEQLAAALAPGTEAVAAAGPAAEPAAQELGIREQRCFERLRQLPAGAMLAFSAGHGGFLQACLRAHHDAPPRLLLASVDEDREIIFEADMLARMLASGEAWVVRRAPAGVPFARPL